MRAMNLLGAVLISTALLACSSKNSGFTAQGAKKAAKQASGSAPSSLSNWTAISSTHYGELFSNGDGKRALFLPSLMLLSLEVQTQNMDTLKPGTTIQDRCFQTKMDILGCSQNTDPSRICPPSNLQGTQVNVRLSDNKAAILRDARNELESHNLRMRLDFPVYSVVLTQVSSVSLAALTAPRVLTSAETQDFQNRILRAVLGDTVTMNLAEMCDLVDPELILQGNYQEENNSYQMNLVIIELGAKG
jgi:hypothetical protein